MWAQSATWKYIGNSTSFGKQKQRLGPFLWLLPDFSVGFYFFFCCFVFSFLELKEKSARTAETLLSMLILISRVLAEALSDRLSPGTLHNVFSQLFTNKMWCWSQD